MQQTRRPAQQRSTSGFGSTSANDESPPASPPFSPRLLGGYRIARRDGTVVALDPGKIRNALVSSMLAVHGRRSRGRVEATVERLAEAVIARLFALQPDGGLIDVEQVQDQIELALLRAGEHEAAHACVLYRQKRAAESAAAALAIGHGDCRSGRLAFAPADISTRRPTMGLFSFIKDAGERLFPPRQAKAQQAPAAGQQTGGGVQATAAPQPSAEAPIAGEAELQDRNAADAIQKHIEGLGLTATGLTVTYRDGEVALYGVAPSQQVKEKIVLAAGNVEGVERVNDMMSVDQSVREPEAKLHTVARGETLSKIAKQYYGDPNQYRRIFEANQPLLTDPDKIYPGQVLRIPN